MQTQTPLQPGHFYHVYNRGNNGEDLFREDRNYRYFLRLYAYHVHPVADTFAYCLMKNHFHLLVRLKEGVATPRAGDGTRSQPSRAFSNLFNAYAKAINKAYQRTGSLFEKNFGRIEVTADAYFARLIVYIHTNAQKHGFVPDFRDWPWSSYHTLETMGNTRLCRAQVWEWFGGRAHYAELHQEETASAAVAALVDDDLV